MVCSLRAVTAVLLLGALLLLIRVPVCTSDACPMSESAQAACKELGDDCCQTKGERAPQSPAPTLAPAPVLPTAALPILALRESPAAAHSPREPLAAPAVLQGVGLYTLFAVFLI